VTAGGGSKVHAAASGHLVVPPVFKTGERCAVALVGSIPVRLRHLRRYQAPTHIRGAADCGRNGPSGRVLAYHG
jgi:hypothetical protein